ncbi:Squalene/phytoene synthase [Echria macrotheca]|uniref:Squalene/phytoene synthase n=1 Tax=Echria macrotheca TaxID=438768 RepID=A0AAJ0B3Z4_9PEZI|nr:Squalene/phytoene synthase [Echria macrotheca]
MNFPKAASRALKHPPIAARQLRRGIATAADISRARNYCEEQLRKGDYEAFLIRSFLAPSTRDAYDAFRALNLELARLPETVSNPTIGRLRIQFWRDAVNQTFAGNPPREPISLLLSTVVSKLGTSGAAPLKFWLLRLINIRDARMENNPFPTLESLEDYAEKTYATLMYMTLAVMSLQSVHLDHLASHIGKACGIVAILRGIPILATPSRPVQGASGSNLGTTRAPSLLLPLDVMADVGLKEEDVFRQGPSAEGFQDAVFKVATRANDHLLTARDMLKKLKRGEGPGHDYEHEGEAGQVYPQSADADITAASIQKASGVLLEGVPAAEYLKRLESADFDPFRVKSSWNLPWRLWQASKRVQI